MALPAADSLRRRVLDAVDLGMVSHLKAKEPRAFWPFVLETGHARRAQRPGAGHPRKRTGSGRLTTHRARLEGL